MRREYRLIKSTVRRISHQPGSPTIAMAAAQNRQQQKEVGENNFIGMVLHDQFPRRDGYAQLGESTYNTYSRPGHASQVEAWINKEFGDDVEATSQMFHSDEVDLYRSQVVDEFMDMLDCMYDTTYSVYEPEVVDVDVIFSRVDSEEFDMCYEPQLWNFN